MALPERLFFPLKKVLKEINKNLDLNEHYDFEDIFHFAFIGKLEICILVDYGISEDEDPFLIYFKTDPDYKDELCKLLDNYMSNSSNIIQSSCGYFSIDNYTLCEDDVTVVIESRNIALLVAVHKNFFSPVLNYKDGIKASVFNLPRTYKLSEDNILYKYTKFFDFLYYEEELFETYKNLYIVKEELDFFKNGGKPISSTNLQVKTNSPKTANAQAKFIKALITANYGSGVANNVRWNINTENNNKNEIGKIRKHFQTKGLAHCLPEGKTVENWIKDIELDIN